MKKILLSGFVILTFIIYSIQQRHERSGAVIVPATATSTSQSTQNVQTTQTTNQTTTPTTSQPAGTYKDGSYVGDMADAFYGNIQVQVTIRNGNITDVQFLQYPNDRRNSIEINQQAMPYLKQEAIKAQNSQVDIVSGATDTSNAFIQSLSTALQKAS